MRTEKQGFKNGGRYVGGFLQLFDWNAKSRKKLFANKCELPEGPKLGKKSNCNLPVTQLHLREEDETGAGSIIKGSTDHSCASSFTDDEGYGIRAPGVVARLMGLDSLPSSNFSDAYSTSISDSQSLGDSHYPRQSFDFNHEHQLCKSGGQLHKSEAPVHVIEPKKTLSRSMERFQTEVLPPKSAKSIPITHHKLLSPIKSPGFIPTKNAAYIMEEAAKIIDPGPQAVTKFKRPGIGSSSVPLRIRDLKDKVEAAHRMSLVGSSGAPPRIRDQRQVEPATKPSKLSEPSQRQVESNAATYLRGQSLSKSWSGSSDTTFRVSLDNKEDYASSKSKGKSISLAIQAKVNVQRREGLNQSSSRSSVNQKEQGEVKSSQPFKSQLSYQKVMHKKSCTHNASRALKHNNRKQNCSAEKDKLPSKLLVFSSQERKSPHRDSVFGRQKTLGRSAGNSRVGSRRLELEVTNSEKELSYSGTKHIPRKKRILDRDFHFEENLVVNDRRDKPTRTITAIDSHLSCKEESMKKSMDVVSFTFTTPMARSTPGFEPSGLLAQKNNGLFTDYRSKRMLLDSDKKNSSCSPEFNAVGVDSLSALLEKTLRELTRGEGSSNQDPTNTSSSYCSTSISRHSPSRLDQFSTLTRLNEEDGWGRSQKDMLGIHFGSDSPLSDSPLVGPKHMFQGIDEVGGCSRDEVEAGHLLDHRQPSPVSILEPSFSTESYDSLDSSGTSNTEGSKQPPSSIQTQKVPSLDPLTSFRFLEVEKELSDSESSPSTSSGTAKHTTSTNWELDYVKEILCNVEVMFEDYAFGRAHEVINSHLFDQLERRKVGGKMGGDLASIQRKELFDRTSECLDMRCRRYVGGGYRAWAEGVRMLKSKELLAKEVYKEISVWRGMGDCMVDELVDRDMSTLHGRWVDFEVEAFEMGVEIEGRIFNSLVREVVVDILLH